MASKKGVSSKHLPHTSSCSYFIHILISIFFKASLAEVKGKKQACAECRKRKKRCGHRDNLSSASEANVPPASAANAADVPPAAVQVDDPVDDNTTTAMIPEPTLEGDQVSTSHSSHSHP